MNRTDCCGRCAGGVTGIGRGCGRANRPSGRYLAQVGALGWTIVVPTLLGVFLGRWIDQRFGTGIFWTGPLLLIGLGIGCWSAWQWIHGP